MYRVGAFFFHPKNSECLVSNQTNTSNLYPLEVVSRSSKTQLKCVKIYSV